jgi:hypothetical protein
MKQIISAVLILSLIHVPALAGQNSDHSAMIASAFDGFRYAMTVEVRADDAEGKTRALRRFEAELADLEKKGVKPSQFMDYFKNSILDRETRADFERLMASVDADSMTADEASAVAMQFMNSRYQQGANYSGGGKGRGHAGLWIAGVLAAGVVTFLVIRHIHHQRDMNQDDCDEVVIPYGN